MDETGSRSQIGLEDVWVVYRDRPLWKRSQTVALAEFSLSIAPGEMIGLVGESGSGKTTAGNVISGLVRPSRGRVLWTGQTLTASRRRRLRGQFQLVDQNPRWALDPRRKVGVSVAEPLAVLGRGTRRERRAAVGNLLAAVGLSDALVDRYPHELSGGQAQRASIARALIAQPTVVVFDEVVSALDVSVQVQVMNLIRDLQQEYQFSGLFISHDLAAVRYAADRIVVLYKGHVLHVADAAAFYSAPLHPYSRSLLDSVTGQNGDREGASSIGRQAAGERRCPYLHACPFAVERCRVERPALRRIGNEWTACHRAEELSRPLANSGG